MKNTMKKLLALSLAAVMALTTACSAGGPATTTAPKGEDGSFYQNLTRLVSLDRESGSGGFSAQSVRSAATCRVLVWEDGPVDLDGLNAETALSRGSYHVLQFGSEAQARAALEALAARGVTASLDRVWNGASGNSAEAIRTAGGTASWGASYSGLRHYGSHYAGTYQNQVTVAVLDTGIDFDHPYLADCVDRERSVNLSSASSRLDDVNGHGTHVAGIIADSTQDAQVTLVSVKTQNDDEHGTGSDATLTAGLLYCLEQGFDVLNLSLGGGHSAVVDAAIRDCVSRGILVVAAAGNDGEQIDPAEHCPAHIQDIVVVGACGRDGKRCYFSNYGSSVDLLAPGEGINSSVPGGGWEEWSGTSMACPFAAAAGALLLCREDQSPAQVEAALKRAVNEKGVLDMRVLLPQEQPEPAVTPEPTPTPAPALPAPDPTPAPVAPEPTPAPADGSTYVVGQEYRYLGRTAVYTGGWQYGRPEGQGKLVFPNPGQFTYLDGTWEGGEFIRGVGEEPSSSGSVYVGGLARVEWDACSYSILWHGSGRFDLAGGDWTETEYDMGEELSIVYHTKDGQVFYF